MSRTQIIAILITLALSTLDAYDILSITFTAPNIAREFGLAAGTLGSLLSSGLAGMLIGALVVAPAADLIGRRLMVLLCLAVIAAGMLLTVLMRSVAGLMAIRLFTGIGIGGMIVVINPLAVEFANLRRRALAVTTMSAGYPIGGIVGGFAAALLLRRHDWRAVFLLGALLCLIMLPLVWWGLPESLGFMLSRRNGRSLARINGLLVRCSHAPIDRLPPAEPLGASPYRQIFSGARLMPTLRIGAVMFMFVSTVYFFLSWSPLIIVGAGFSPSQAASIAGISSFAGLMGTMMFGLLSSYIRIEPLVIASMIGLGAATAAFGLAPASFASLVTTAALAWFFLNAGTVGLYTTIGNIFDAPVRATGTGFAIGVGRAGSTIGPVIAGLLLSAIGDRGIVCAVMAGGAVVAALLLLGSQDQWPVAKIT